MIMKLVPDGWIHLMIAWPTTILNVQSFGKNCPETHVYILKYCLQIAKCDDMECCQPMQSNVQDVLCGKFLLAPLALSGGPYLIDPCKG